MDWFCRCHKPVNDDILPPAPENQTDGNGKVVAVICKRCTRVIACPCEGCGDWIDRMFDHVEVCQAGRAKRTKPTEGPWLPGVPR